MGSTKLVESNVKEALNGKRAKVVNFHFCRYKPQDTGSYDENNLQAPGFDADDQVIIISHIVTDDNLFKEWCYVMRNDGFQGWVSTMWLKIIR